MNLLRDMGLECRVGLYTESSTAEFMCSQTGAGRARHIKTRFHGILDIIKRGVVVLNKIETERNPADLLTKPQSEHIAEMWLCGDPYHTEHQSAGEERRRSEEKQ